MVDGPALGIDKEGIKEMLVSDKEALERLGSPLNLMNRLSSARNKTNSMSVFGIGSSHNTKIVRESTPAFNPFKRQVSLENTAPIPAPSSSSIPSPEPKQPNLDDLVNNADSQVKLGLAHDEALGVLVDAVKMVKLKLDDIKPEKLSSIISATSKVVDQIQRQRIDANKGRDSREVHFHFYTPTQKTMEDYNVIDVG